MWVTEYQTQPTENVKDNTTNINKAFFNLEKKNKGYCYMVNNSQTYNTL